MSPLFSELEMEVANSLLLLRYGSTGDVRCTSMGAGDVPCTSRGTSDVPCTSRGAGDVPRTSRGTSDVPCTSRGTSDVPCTSRGTGNLPRASRVRVRYTRPRMGRFHGPAPAPEASNDRQRPSSKAGTSDGGDSDLVPIGKGFAKVPLRLVSQLPQMYYTIATRALMSAVFTREEMATHTLSGRPSPAFPDYPVKSRLDPRIVEDVVSTVVKYCNSAESIVRAAVTTKCADETKMFRNRQMKRRAKENIPPSSSDSSESSGEYDEEQEDEEGYSS